jgi:hypothetical protein
MMLRRVAAGVRTRQSRLLKTCGGGGVRGASLRKNPVRRLGAAADRNRGSYLRIFRRVPAVSAFVCSLFHVLILATVVSNSSAMDDSVSPRLTR